MGADTVHPLPGNELTDESEVEVLNCQCDSNVVVIWDCILVHIRINDSSLIRYEAQTRHTGKYILIDTPGSPKFNDHL